MSRDGRRSFPVIVGAMCWMAACAAGGGGEDGGAAGEGGAGDGGSVGFIGSGGPYGDGSAEASDASSQGVDGATSAPREAAADAEANADATSGSQDASVSFGDSSLGADTGVERVPVEASADDGSDASVGLGITVGPGLSVDSLDWWLSGPHLYAGTIHFGDAQAVRFIIGGVDAAPGYTITLSGTDIFGNPCRGVSPPFAVLPGQLSETSVAVLCREGVDAASGTPGGP